jgi:hypothetical protein
MQGKKLYCWKSLKPDPLSLSLPNSPLAVSLLEILMPASGTERFVFSPYCWVQQQQHRSGV